MTDRVEIKPFASGSGWHVVDLTCHSGPNDKPFEEEHNSVAVAAVLSGTFSYRTTQGRALLAPGSILLGNHGRCFQCEHEHGIGDRCISFHFTPDYWEEIASSTPGKHRGVFNMASLPPSKAVLPTVSLIEATLGQQEADMEVVAHDLAAIALGLAIGSVAVNGNVQKEHERRVSQIIRHIETTAYDLENNATSLAALANQTRLSRYHFLRIFRKLVGIPPHQYTLSLRLKRAAVVTRTTNTPLSIVALEAGFNDLSTFIRQFRGIMGVSPREYRRLF